MSKTTINRRQFLSASGRGVAGGVAATLVPAAILPNSAWAENLSAIDQAGADVLVRVCRLLYPHDRLNDGYYMACVESLDKKAGADAALAAQLKAGVASLNGMANGRFLELGEAEQVQALTEVEDQPFFQAVRGHMVVALYTDRKVWSELGYEGPSFPYGGYLERGFDDIDWLPDV